MLARVRALAVPPAWTDVWICVDPRGHLQATGRDQRGRKQYRYHARFRARRDESKFGRLIEFAAVLPRIRRRVGRDLARPGLTREKVLAAVVRLLELSLIRVGNQEYAKLNRSFGLTTLRDRHVSVEAGTLRFRFRGKSGRQHEVTLRDRRLATVVKRCRDLPGQELFQYQDADGDRHTVTSDDVNDYLRETAGADVTTRDFRVWAGTVLAYRALRAAEPASDARTIRRNVLEAVRVSAERLGNTPPVARASYVHPAVLAAYEGGMIPAGNRRSATLGTTRDEGIQKTSEAAVVRLLRATLERDAKRSSGVG